MVGGLFICPTTSGSFSSDKPLLGDEPRFVCTSVGVGFWSWWGAVNESKGAKMVTRYAPVLGEGWVEDTFTATLEPDPNGDYVLVEDYLRLEKECAELRSKIAELESRNGRTN